MKMKQVMLMALAGLFCVVDAAINMEHTYPASKNEKWDFEIKNKDMERIYVTIQNGNKLIIREQRVEASSSKKEKDHGYLRLGGLNLGLPVLITINEKAPFYYVSGYMIERGAKDRTIFLTYENDTLRTQSGTGFFSKETQSGLSLKNNIKDKDIERLSDTVVEQNLREINNKTNEIEARNRVLESERELKEEHEREEPEDTRKIINKGKKNNIPNKQESEKTAKLIVSGEELSPEELRDLAIESVHKKPAKQPVVELNIPDTLFGGEAENLRKNIPSMTLKELEEAREDVKAQKYSIDKKTNEQLIQEINSAIVSRARTGRSSKKDALELTIAGEQLEEEMSEYLKQLLQEIPTIARGQLTEKIQSLKMMRQYATDKDKKDIDVVIKAINDRIQTGR